LSKEDVDSLPRVSIFFFTGVDPNNIHAGYGFINIPVFEDINGSYYISDESDVVFLNLYHWKFATGLVTEADKLKVFPNPTSNSVTIKLEEDYISFNKVQSVSYQLYSYEQVLLTTLSPINHVGESVIVPSYYITNSGTYFIKCNVTYLDDKSQLATDEFTVKFIKL